MNATRSFLLELSIDEYSNADEFGSVGCVLCVGLALDDEYLAP